MLHYFSEGDFDYLVYEFCSKGDMHYEIRDRVLLRKYLREIVGGLITIHGFNIIHRDIKPNNILLTQDDICKIADFGLSKIIDII